MHRLLLVVIALVLAPALARSAERYDSKELTAVLATHVTSGRVNYPALKEDPRFAKCLADLSATDPAKLTDASERLAFWINAYNAFTLKLITDNYPVKSINDLASGGRYIAYVIGKTPWDIRFVTINGHQMTLNDIEHGIIRKEFKEPRVHFALVCAAVSCPNLRSEAYSGDQLDRQLEDQGRSFLSDATRNAFDARTRTATVSRIFDWYARDFGADDTAILSFLARYAPTLNGHSVIDDPAKWKLRYTEYDWALNEAKP